MKGRLKKLALTADPYSMFRLTAAVFLCGVVLGSIFYGEPFLFWKYPYSDLGTLKTVSGYPNTTAFLVFDTSLIICSATLFRIGKWYRLQGVDSRLKEVLAYIGAAGALIMLAPCDTHDLYHTFGSTLFVLSLWLFMQGNLVKIRYFFNRAVFVIMLLITEGGLLPYAWTHLNNNPVEYSLQKFAVWGCFGALAAGSYMLEQRQEKSIGTEAELYDEFEG